MSGGISNEGMGCMMERLTSARACVRVRVRACALMRVCVSARVCACERASVCMRVSARADWAGVRALNLSLILQGVFFPEPLRQRAEGGPRAYHHPELLLGQLRAELNQRPTLQLRRDCPQIERGQPHPL